MPKKVKYQQIGHKRAENFSWKQMEKAKSVPKKAKYQQTGHKNGDVAHRA